MAVEIRQMRKDDLPQVLACMQAAFEHSFDPKVLSYEFDGCHRFNADGLQVAVDDERIVGTIWGAWNGRRAVISGLGVHPEYQGQGIAARLIATVETHFRAKGVTRFSLEVLLDNEKVIPIYEHLGFKHKPLIAMGKDLNNLDGTPITS